MNRISRREFLECGPAGALVAVSPLLGIVTAALDGKGDELAPTEREALVDFSFSLDAMKSLPVIDGIRTCARIGYDGVGLMSIPGWACEPARLSKEDRVEIRTVLGDLGLELPVLSEHMTPVVDDRHHRKNLNRIRSVAELGNDLSPGRQPVISSGLGGKEHELPAIRSQLVDRLGDWAAVAEKSKTVLVVKAHVGDAVHTPKVARWVLDQVSSPWLKLNYDFSHFQLAEAELEESLKLLLGQTALVSIKDSTPQSETFRFVLPGEGSIDYVKYFRFLREAGYRGSVCVEVSAHVQRKPGYDPVQAAQRCYNLMAPYFDKTGLRRTGRWPARE